MNGEAMPKTSILPVNVPSPICTRQRALGISNVVPEDVKMQATLRQQRQTTHEAQQEGPPLLKPRPLRKLPKNDVGRDTPLEMAELTEK